ncbi:MAG: GntR family transcriptional regulator [Desulfobacterota bacterium]|nr:GntR family transcriptional regulator [Thermodesulfobacteriota bacterium]
MENPKDKSRGNPALPARERVYSYLKSAILSGRLPPGHKLTEENLAKTLKVSRTPVREVLHKLEAEGLVKPRNKRGFFVAGDSREEVEELFEIRAILEGYALRIVSKRISDKELDQLNRFIQKAEEALKRGKIGEVFKWNTRFHDALHSMIGDKRQLLRLMVDIRKFVLRYRKDTLRYPDGGKRAVEGHRKVIMALQLRDPDLCERVMREHIREAKEDALLSLFGVS